MSRKAITAETNAIKAELKDMRECLVGLVEVRDTLLEVNKLLNDLHVAADLSNVEVYRVGRSSEKRPLVIKLRNPKVKADILYKAKGLKNLQKWPQTYRSQNAKSVKKQF